MQILAPLLAARERVVAIAADGGLLTVGGIQRCDP